MTKHSDSKNSMQSYSGHGNGQTTSSKKHQMPQSSNRPGSAPKQPNNHSLQQSHSHGHVGTVNTRTIANHPSYVG